ncbi:MAG: membrane dipeptidase [Bryobacteraceae bacterium]|jgi:membrane dipeptidase
MSFPVIGRRGAIQRLGGALAVAPAILRGRFALFAQSPAEYSARAIRIVEEGPVVDLLNQFRFEDYSEKPPRIDRWLHQPGSFTAADAGTYQRSRIDAFALGYSANDYTEGLRFFAEWNSFLAGYSEWLTRIDHADDFDRAHKSRKIGILLTLQNSTHFRMPVDVDEFFGLGQRLSQLTYNFNNRIGSGFLEQRDGGLSVFGLSIMKRMEQVGMAVDVSHCGDQTTLDALDAATKPVLFTHAACRALMPGHMRLKTDEAIRKMAKTGGVMGINFIRFMVRDREPVTIEHVLDHFDYARKLVGVEHLAVGSDLDIVGNANPIGGGFQPTNQPNFERYGYHVDPDGRLAVKGLDHPRRMFDLTEGLIRRGYSDSDIRSILGGNAVRVLSQIWPK